MSSNLRIVKICEYCKREFIAKKTTSKTCSEHCAKRFYKQKLRDDKIKQTELKTEIKRRPDAYITEEQIKIINAKEFLSLKEAALILNISPLTARRWIFSGRLKSYKVAKKHIIKREEIDCLLS